MTVINGIEIDYIEYESNIVKQAILNNDPIEQNLHVIAVISNPCLFARRYILMKEFINRIEQEEINVELYIVELAYGDQKFIITEKTNRKHLQLRTECPIWHKENMINLGVKKLLPKNWRAFAWIDADIEFENATWALDTLKILNGCKDVVQIFSHAVDMSRNKQTMTVFNSAGYQRTKGLPVSYNQPNLWHPGFAWAMTRKAYERLGGLYEKAILGSGDNIMMLSLMGLSSYSLNELSTVSYKQSVSDYEKKSKTLRFGYVPGVIRHYFHGSKKNRKYQDRWAILVKHNYDPNIHVKKDKNGLIVPTEHFPCELKSDILEYFRERNEDE
uniref:Glycosyltransferase n=1 Tax=viral metagenome TaxID=1070528 RepID=A0A6C0I0E9_9ZZZZ